MDSITSLLELDTDFQQLMDDFDAGFEMASTIEPRSPEWHWRRRIVKNAVNIVAGEQGLGKSQFGTLLASEESHKGGPKVRLPRFVHSPGEEDKNTVIVPRLIAYDADLTHVAMMNEDLGLLLTPDHMDRLYGYIMTVGATLVVIDPVTAFLSSKTGFLQGRQPARGVEGAARDRLGCEVHIPLGGVHEEGQQAREVNMVGGSIGWTAAPRSVLILTRDRDGKFKTDRILWHPKCNVGPEQDPLACRIVQVPYDTLGSFETSYLDFVGEVDESADLDEALGHEPKPRSKLDEAKSWLREHLADGPQDAHGTEAMATVARIKPQTLRRARETLNIESRKQGTEGWTWHLPNTDQ